MKDLPKPSINFASPGAHLLWQDYLEKHPGHMRSFAGRFTGQVAHLLERQPQSARLAHDGQARCIFIEEVFRNAQRGPGGRYVMIVSGCALADLVHVLGKCWVHGNAVMAWYANRRGPQTYT